MVADSSSLSRLVPGFDFLEGLVKNAGAAIPGMGQWVAPTIDPAELDKRIQELRTVQYWLEQNARMLGATIQALEVQRMTLSTLQNMNVQMADLRDSLMIPMTAAASAGPAKADKPGSTAPAAAPAAAKPRPAKKPAPSAGGATAQGSAAAGSPGRVDPMQWWGALTKQFTELASAALQEGAAGAAKTLSGAAAEPAVKTRAAPHKAATRSAAKPGRAAPRKRAGI